MTSVASAVLFAQTWSENNLLWSETENQNHDWSKFTIAFLWYATYCGQWYCEIKLHLNYFSPYDYTLQVQQ